MKSDSKLAPSIIFACLGLATLAFGMGFLIWKSSQSDKNSKERDAELRAELNRIEQGSISVTSEEILSKAEKLNRGRTAASRFAQSEDVDERVSLVRDGSKHKKSIQAYLNTKPNLNFRIKGPFLQMDDGTGSMRFLATSLEDTRVINVDFDTSLIDWESFAGTNITTFEDLPELASKKQGAPIRCLLGYGSKIDYYNFGYNAQGWQCYRLGDPNSANYLWGYAKRGSDVEKEISSFLKGDGKEVPMILWIRIKGKVPVGTAQVEITDLASHTWRLPKFSKIVDYYESHKEEASAE